MGSWKLHWKWEGPYRIQDLLPYNKYALVEIANLDKSPRIIHTDRVIMFLQNDCYNETNLAVESFARKQNPPKHPIKETPRGSYN